MRTNILSGRDVAATVLVAAATAVFASADGRAAAVAILALGIAACGTGSAADAFMEDGPSRIYVAIASVIGVCTLAFGVIAVVTGGELSAALLMGGIGVLWLFATGRHALTAPASPEQATVRRSDHVDEKVGV